MTRGQIADNGVIAIWKFAIKAGHSPLAKMVNHHSAHLNASPDLPPGRRFAFSKFGQRLAATHPPLLPSGASEVAVRYRSGLAWTCPTQVQRCIKKEVGFATDGQIQMHDIVDRLLDFLNYDAASSRYLLRKEAAEEIRKLRIKLNVSGNHTVRPETESEAGTEPKGNGNHTASETESEAGTEPKGNGL